MSGEVAAARGRGCMMTFISERRKVVWIRSAGDRWEEVPAAETKRGENRKLRQSKQEKETACFSYACVLTCTPSQSPSVSVYPGRQRERERERTWEKALVARKKSNASNALLPPKRL